MVNLKLKIIFLTSLLFFLASCDRIENTLFGKQEITYTNCLHESFGGSHNYTAEETRKLCAEIANTTTFSYEYTDDGEIFPNNEFTKCYDKKIKNLSGNADEKAKEVAKLLCKYAPDE